MLEQLFGSKTRTKLLYLFFQYPARPFYVREMAREIDSQLNAVRREITILEKAGLIGHIKKSDIDTGQYDDTSVAKAKYYCLRTDCIFYLELKSLLMKGQILRERDLVEKLKERDILITDAKAFRVPRDIYIRISVATEEENSQFIKVLSELK